MTVYLKRRKPKKMGAVKPDAPIRSPSHLKWVRGHECACPDCASRVYFEGKIEAAHVRTGTNGGTAQKPGDDWAIPLCSLHHRRQHEIGEAAFEKMHRINMKQIAQSLADRSPHLRKLRA